MATDDDPASEVYKQQVAGINAAAARSSRYAPPEPLELFIRNRRAPQSLAELPEIERTQFARMWKDRDPDRMLQFGDEEEDYPLSVEVADVVDAAGTRRYILWGWNYGSIYLMEPSGLECVAFASQHVVERWHPEQRPLFWAMDRALARGDHGFTQPMQFDWWDDAKWAAIAERPRGTVGSEAHVREWFASG